MRIIPAAYSYSNNKPAFKSNLTKAKELEAYITSSLGEIEAKNFFETLDKKVKSIEGLKAKAPNSKSEDVKIELAPGKTSGKLLVSSQVPGTAWKASEEIDIIKKGARLAKACYRAMKKATRDCFYK